MIVLSNGLALGIFGLLLALIGAIIAGTAMTAKPPKGAPDQGDLYIDLDKAKRGLWLIAGGTVVQIGGGLQAVLTALTN